VPVVEGASKYKQKTTEAPASVTIITSDEIKKQGYQTLADLLRNVQAAGGGARLRRAGRESEHEGGGQRSE